MTPKTLQMLTDGEIRKNRIYEGVWVGSACGRALLKKGGTTVVVGAPRGEVITNDATEATLARRAGMRVIQVAAFDRATILQEVEEADSSATERSLRWLLGV